MSGESEVEARIAELEARLGFLEQSQQAGHVGSWRARLGPESVLQLSEEAYRILGVEAGTPLRNLDFYLLLHPDDRAHFLEAVILVRTEQVRQEVMVRMPSANGPDRVLLFTAAPAVGEGSETGGIAGTVSDVIRWRSSGVDRELQQRLTAEAELRRALEAGELFLGYQPILSLESGRFIGAEALVRWEHPERGRLEPTEFVGLAEESGLIFRLGAWVLSSACRQLRVWMDQGVGPEFVMSVNLSAVQLRAEGLPLAVKESLGEAGVSGSNVLVEVTESVLVAGTLDERSLRSIRDLGVHVAIDDFGTKYSSLSYLSRLPVDALKIDAAFVHAADDGPGRAVVAAIAALGKALGLHVTAEGVETDEQLTLVRTVVCNAAQGFLISEPLPPDACLALVRPIATPPDMEP